METLSDRFFKLLAEEKVAEALQVLLQAPDTSESLGLLGYVYYVGIEGHGHDYDTAFELFDMAVKEDDSLSLYYLGIMCENGDVPAKYAELLEGGYGEHYAESFMTRCARGGGIMAEWASLWLGRRAIRSNDMEKALEYLKRAAEFDNEEAIELLTQLCTERAEAMDYADVAANMEMYRWQERLYELHPQDESYNFGRLLYGDIAGIPSDRRRALELYAEDFEYGYSQGARALALHFEREAEMEHDAEQSAKLLAYAEQWHRFADMNAENDYEPEQIIEED